MSQRARHRVRGTVLLALLLSLVCVPCLAWAAPSTAIVPARVRVFQEYKVSTSGLPNAFEYVVEPVEKDAPLPVDEDGMAFAKFTLTREEDRWLVFPVEVSVDPAAAPYVYHYTMRPAQKELSDGLHYVDVLSTSLAAGVNEYLLEIHVQPSNVDAAASVVTPTVHTEGWDGPKVTDPGWRVGYQAPSDAAGKSATTGSAGTSTTNAASDALGGSLAKTGDVLALGVMACAACVGMLMLAHALLLRRRAGGGHA